jgi:hypothetical protein
MKRHDFEDVLRIGKLFFLCVGGLLRTIGVQIPAQILGYLTGYSWDAVVISCKDGVSSGEGASCVIFYKSIVRV